MLREFWCHRPRIELPGCRQFGECDLDDLPAHQAAIVVLMTWSLAEANLRLLCERRAGPVAGKE